MSRAVGCILRNLGELQCVCRVAVVLGTAFNAFGAKFFAGISCDDCVMAQVG
jgi:hypothetical protein